MKQYLKQVYANMEAHPTWRKGQAYFNTLYFVNPQLADKVRGTLLDPFYKDDNIRAFMDWLINNWE